MDYLPGNRKQRECCNIIFGYITDLPGLINNVSPFVITIFAPFAILSLCLRHFLSVVKLQGVLLALH